VSELRTTEDVESLLLLRNTDFYLWFHFDDQRRMMRACSALKIIELESWHNKCFADPTAITPLAQLEATRPTDWRTRVCWEDIIWHD
jgi:hypothetical protein